MNNDYDTIDPLDPLITKLSKALEELGYRFNILAETVQKISWDSGNPVPKAIYDAFEVEKSNEELEKSEPIYDISWIRKRMKCCKNPMERKQLEKQLNAAYKARKKARKKNERTGKNM